ncbi:cobalt ECF transporter T component CbiQ [Blautia hydrogenotrophica]|uniref:cobalt ECF transporter T component CbiQ n=1 Tax=Blautia hydrogenotrophica TaxID=53443 RepID=UPI0006C6EBB1|nr:cobalt ECF transporter T component CbiQ [Blautia hydrogenotrophica]MEE0463885.1 cobalt ECF transporter T component CbiQ [Blautia hydrogenotrophica]CUN00353.1 Energy-coupling factor transporter transmembrane protein CbiQ [Blautia hydrogenotrophica]SCH84545.1 Energy-coupling factor transporter transmembrane protein CbiQ [uncultured Blautia sp.]
MIAIDQLCYRSKLRYHNAGEKFAFTTLTLLFCVVSRSVVIAGIVLVTTGILTIYKGGIPFFRYLKFLTVPLVFLILSTVAIVLNVSKTPSDLFALSIGSWYLTGSKASLLYAVQLILTALASVSCLFFFSFSTPITDFIHVLQKLHCPRLIIELMLLIYRFIFILMEISSAITTAQNSRLGNKDFITSCKSFGFMASALLIRAIKKSNLLYDAMESRCYDGTIRVLHENFPPKRREILYILLFETFLLAVTVMLQLR